MCITDGIHVTLWCDCDSALLCQMGDGHPKPAPKDEMREMRDKWEESKDVKWNVKNEYVCMKESVIKRTVRMAMRSRCPTPPQHVVILNNL